MVSGISGLSGMMQQIDPEQMRQKRFKQADTNGDGRLDSDELTAMSEEMTVAGGPQFDISQFIQEADSDGDGAISDSEDSTFFQKMKARRPQGPPPPQGGGQAGGPASFSDLDTNGDSASSLLEMLQSVLKESANAAVESQGETTGDSGEKSTADQESLFKQLSLLLSRYTSFSATDTDSQGSVNLSI